MKDVIERLTKLSKVGFGYDLTFEDREALKDAVEALSASPAGVVKPLEWNNYTDGSGYIAFDAMTMIGQYSVWRIDEDKPWLLHIPGSSDHIEHASAEAARAAAFADYSARIMSAIEPDGVWVETPAPSTHVRGDADLLRKAISLAEDGMFHVGVALQYQEDDTARRWLEGAVKRVEELRAALATTEGK